jgi:hypothetical protein
VADLDGTDRAERTRGDESLHSLSGFALKSACSDRAAARQAHRRWWFLDSYHAVWKRITRGPSWRGRHMLRASEVLRRFGIITHRTNTSSDHVRMDAEPTGSSMQDGFDVMLRVAHRRPRYAGRHTAG